MKKMVVGVVSAPGLPETLLNDIMNSLEDLDGPSAEDDVDWDTEFKTDPLTSSAEYISETFDRLESIKKDNGWDMAIAITDLPSISSRKVVLSEFDYNRKLSLISAPAIGVFKNKKKLETLLIHHMETLHDEKPPENTEQIQPDFLSR